MNWTAFHLWDDSGSINMLGLDNRKHEYEIKEQIAAVFDELPFQEMFTAKQLSIMMGGIYRDWDKVTFEKYLDRFQLPAKKKCGKFSKGMKMKLQIAAALSHNAKLLIMDEATTGLDPVVRNEILDIFREYLQDEERSILMSSHITSDLEKIADSVTFIDRGKLLITGYKDDILDCHGMIRCSKADYAEIDKADFISARMSEFGVEALVADRAAAKQKYSGAMIEKTTLEEIMLFYVNAGKKEWN
ncbi:MAG: ABC transporter ATP-binding protein, partial [Oscillospiraceae bacterium]|nr:ABC transporter ATP-binding protein [Oscillospiraceae bacterium]